MVFFNGDYGKEYHLINWYKLFYKQPAYKQLALGLQIAKQLLGLNPLLLSNIKKDRLRKSFLCNKREIAVNLTIHESIIGKILKSLFIYIDLESWKSLYSSQT